MPIPKFPLIIAKSESQTLGGQQFGISLSLYDDFSQNDGHVFIITLWLTQNFHFC